MDASVFADLTLDELRSRLTEARDALHRLSTGTQSVSVRHADRQVQYSESQSSHLRAYINTLAGAIEARERGTSGRHRPIYLGLG